MRKFAHLIKKQRLVCDVFLYLISLRCEGGIFISSEKLTNFRIHGNQTGCWVQRFHSFDEWLKCIFNTRSRWAYDLARLASLSVSLEGRYPNLYTWQLVWFVILINSMPISEADPNARINPIEAFKHIRFYLRFTNYEMKRNEGLSAKKLAVNPIKNTIGFLVFYLLHLLDNRPSMYIKRIAWLLYYHYLRR